MSGTEHIHWDGKYLIKVISTGWYSLVIIIIQLPFSYHYHLTPGLNQFFKSTISSSIINESLTLIFRLNRSSYKTGRTAPTDNIKYRQHHVPHAATIPHASSNSRFVETTFFFFTRLLLEILHLQVLVVWLSLNFNSNSTLVKYSPCFYRLFNCAQMSPFNSEL